MLKNKVIDNNATQRRQTRSEMVIRDDLSGSTTLDSRPCLFIVNSSRFYLWPMIAISTTGTAIVIGLHWSFAFAAAWSVCCCASFGFLINDLWDKDVDRANMRLRLTHLGTTGRVWAFIVALLFGVSGVVVTYVVYPSMVEPIALLLLILAMYTIYLRKTLLLATITSAAVACAIFWVPIWSAGANIRVPIWLQLIIVGTFVFQSGREVLLDIKDRPGDLIDYRLTIPILFGPDVSFIAAIVLMVLGIVTMYVAVISTHTQIMWAWLLAVIPMSGAVFNMVKRGIIIKRSNYVSNTVVEFARGSRLLMLSGAAFPWLMVLMR